MDCISTRPEDTDRDGPTPMTEENASVTDKRKYGVPGRRARIIRARAPLRLGLAGASDFSQEVDLAVDEDFEVADPLILHKAVYRRIIEQFNDGRPLSCRVTTFCDAPPGSEKPGSVRRFTRSAGEGSSAT